MPAYGKVKVDTITYDLSGTATDVSVANIATKASPTFTGTVTVPTPTAGDDSTKAASTAFVVASFATKASPAFTGTATGVNLTLSGDLTVNGTTTTINTTTLQVEDKNIEIGKVSSPSDTTADGGGLTLLGATNKTWNWVNATDAWTSSEHIHLGDNKKLKLGTGEDFVAYFDGSNTYLAGVAGNVNIQAKHTENSIIAIPDGAVELYHNNVKKIETGSQTQIMYGNLELTDGWSLYLDNGFNNASSRIVNAGGSGVAELKIYTQASGGSSTQALHINGSQNATFAGTVSDSKGDLRKIPINAKSSSYTLISSDAGKTIRTTAGVTVPSGIFYEGEAITIFNNSGSDITITQGSNQTTYNAADAATGNRTLAGRGLCTILCVSNNVFVISGAGLS